MSGFGDYKARLRRCAAQRRHAEARLCPTCGWLITNDSQMECPNCGADVFNQRWPEVEHPYEPPLDTPQVPDTIPPEIERSSPYGFMPQLPANPDDSSSGLTVPEHFEQGDMISPQDLAAFMQGYFEAALWTSGIGEDFAESQNAEFGEDESFQAFHGGGLSGDQSMSDAGLTEDHIDPTSKAKQTQECRNFVNDNSADLYEYAERRYGWSQAGHDFWLTRNDHGTGYWDRDPGPVGQRLTEAAKVYGEVYAYVGDDDMVYFQ